MFNLMKFAEENQPKAVKSPESYESQLRANADSNGVEDVGLKTTAKQLAKQHWEEKADSLSTTEAQMDEVHVKAAEMITERLLEDLESEVGYKRDSELFTQNVRPIDLMNQAQEQEHLKAYKAAEQKDRDTSFWDKYVDHTLGGLAGKQIDRMGPSQLANHPDRFGKLPTEAAELLKKTPKVEELVTASLRDMDAMLFHVFYKAASEGRDLNAEERSIVDTVSVDKQELLGKLAARERFSFDEPLPHGTRVCLLQDTPNEEHEFLPKYTEGVVQGDLGEDGKHVVKVPGKGVVRMEPAGLTKVKGRRG
jgi:hypothetical protein